MRKDYSSARGEVHRVTFDSATARPTSLVVRKGWLFHEDKEIPAGAISTIAEGAVTLNMDKSELKNQNNEEQYSVEWSGNSPALRK